MDPTFEQTTIPTTEARIQAALAAGHGCVVFGRPGCGKTHAVERAVNGALWTEVASGPLAVARIVADLARQTDTSAPLRDYVEHGWSAALATVEGMIGDRVLVVDGIERLRVPFEDAFEPDVGSLWSEELEGVRGWLATVVKTRRVVAIGRRRMAEVDEALSIPQLAPRSWTSKLVDSPRGYVAWDLVAAVLKNTPGTMRLAELTMRLAGPGPMNAWLRECQGRQQEQETGESDGREEVSALVALFRRVAPAGLLHFLAVLDVVGEMPRASVESLARVDDDLAAALDLARNAGLLRERADVVRLPRFARYVVSPGDLSSEPARDLARSVCKSWLAEADALDSLEPGSALRVLDAHQLLLSLGDFDGALDTARLHLGGLVAFARALSVAEDWPAARHAYGSIRSLITDRPRLANDRVRSYVVHYHAYNTYRARALTLDRVANDYRSAIELWRDNALWHSRSIALCVERGDRVAARSALATAYASVPDHPRRDAYLRVRAAWHVRDIDPWFTLELLDPLDLQSTLVTLSDVDGIAASQLEQLVARWATGVRLERLEVGDGRALELRGPTPVRVERGEDGAWLASTAYPPARGEGATPLAATRALAKSLADEVLRLVGTPTGHLSRADVGVKGLYLGAVNLVTSEIGLPFVSHRWLIGRVERDSFLPTATDLGPVPLPVPPATVEGYFFARVPVDRTGSPSGPVEKIVSAGAGRSKAELLEALRRLADGDDGEAA